MAKLKWQFLWDTAAKCFFAKTFPYNFNSKGGYKFKMQAE